MFRVKQKAIWRVALALGVGFVQACAGSSSISQSQTKDQQARPANGPATHWQQGSAAPNAGPALSAAPDTLDDLLGQDRGFAAVVFYAADIAGSLDVCG